jgi:hypothetical protein
MTEDDFMLHQIREEQKVCFEEIMGCLDRIDCRLDSMCDAVRKCSALLERVKGLILEKKPEDHA